MKVITLILLLLFPVYSQAWWYVSNPQGTLAFDSVETFDKVTKSRLAEDQQGIINLLDSGKLKILSPGTPVDVKCKTGLVCGVIIPGSSKPYAVLESDLQKVNE